MENSSTEIEFTATVYAGSGIASDAIHVSHDEVRAFFGREHAGTAEDCRALAAALVASGAPDWVVGSGGWVDDRGHGYIRPAHSYARIIEAIANSALRNEIVHLETATAGELAVLEADCENSTDDGRGGFEFWGADGDGDGWRVHVAPQAHTISDDQIYALASEAGTAGDSGMVEICDRAIDGDADARQECAHVIAEAGM